MSWKDRWPVAAQDAVAANEVVGDRTPATTRVSQDALDELARRRAVNAASRRRRSWLGPRVIDWLRPQ
jgi:hypothetical protein